MNFHTFLNIIYFRVASVVILVLFLNSCASQYREHFEAEYSKTPAISGEYHVYLNDDSLSVLPDRDIKNQIIGSIAHARERIWIEIYMWTDKDILQALIDAHKRSVDVRVLLERNVYDLPRVNVPVYSELEKSGISVKYTDSYRFTFTHAKFWIIDGTYSISTGNFTKSFFNSNRDFIFSSSDTQTLEFLSALFLADFSYLNIDRSTIPNHIVLSPVDARPKIEYLLQNAVKDIKIYTQTLTDEGIIDIIEKKEQEGVHLQICTADNESNRITSSGKDLSWIQVKKPYIHAKILLIDGEKIFIGSQNFTTNSLQNNREVGIIVSDSGDLYSQIAHYFQKDCIFE